MAISTVFVELKASISDMQMKFGEVKSELDGLSRKASTTGEKMAAVGKGLTLGLGAGAIAVGAAAVDLAEKFDAAHASMETAFKAAGVSAAQVKGPISAVDKAMEKFGYTNAETEGAVSKLAIAHVPLNQIMTDTTLAANIAAQRHIDLSTAMTIVTKASEGNVGALRRMGIDLPVVAGGAAKVASAQTGLATAQDNVNKILAKTPDAMKSSSKAHATYEAAVGKVAVAQKKLTDAQSAGGTIIDQLSGRFNGQAAAAADTFNGKMKVLKVTAEDYGVKLGNFLIPKIETLAKDTEDVVQWFQKHKAAADALAIAVGGLGAIFIGAYGIQSVKKFGNAISDSATTVKDLVTKIPGIGTSAKTAATAVNLAATEMDADMKTSAGSIEKSASRIDVALASEGTASKLAVAAAGAAPVAALAALTGLAYLGGKYLPGNTSLLDRATGTQAEIDGHPVVTPAQLAQQQALSNKQPVPMGPNGMPIPPSFALAPAVAASMAIRTANAGAAGAVDWAAVARAAIGMPADAAARFAGARANGIVATHTPPKTTKAHGNVTMVVR